MQGEEIWHQLYDDWHTKAERVGQVLIKLDLPEPELSKLEYEKLRQRERDEQRTRAREQERERWRHHFLHLPWAPQT